MSDVNWGNYAEAYKTIHDKLNEILTKLDQPGDPAVQDVIDRATRVLGTITDVSKVATQKKIDLTATGIIHTPTSGKKIRLKGFVWSSNADIVTALRFGTAGDLLFAIQTKGVVGMNLVGCNIEGAIDEALYGYLSGTGTMKGTVLIEEV